MKNANNLDDFFKEKLGGSKAAHPEHLWQGIEHRLDQINGGSNNRRILLLSVALLIASLMIGSAIIFNVSDSSLQEDQINKEIIVSDNNDVRANVITNFKEETDIQPNQVEQVVNQSVISNTQVGNNSNSSIITSEEITKTQENKELIITADNDTHQKQAQEQDNHFLNESGNLIKVYPSTIEKENQNIYVEHLGSNSSNIQSNQSIRINDFVSKDGCLDYVDKPYNKMYFDILGGSQMTDRLLYTEDAEWQDNVNLRNESELVKNSYSVGLRFTYMFDRGVSLKSGLLYSVINEQFKYVSGIKTITIRNEETGEIIRQYEENEYSVNNNRYVFYDIPLLISYNWTRKNIFAEFNSGVIMNIFASQKGEFYNQNEERIKFNKLAKNPFKSFVGGSLYTSAAFGYNFPNNNVSFFVEPHVRYHLGSISAKSNPVKQKYVNYGLYLGVRYQIK